MHFVSNCNFAPEIKNNHIGYGNCLALKRRQAITRIQKKKNIQYHLTSPGQLANDRLGRMGINNHLAYVNPHNAPMRHLGICVEGCVHL